MFKGFNEFLSYSKSQRRGLWALLALAIILTVGLYFDELFYSQPQYDLSAYYEAIEQAKARKAKRDSLSKTYFQTFNPNKTNSEFLVKTGLSAQVADRLINYVQKGGRFRQKEDLLKIYGMDTSWYNDVESYVKIENQNAFKEYSPKPRYNFQEFDPNLVSKEKLVTMGLRAWQAKNILGFREKYRPFKNDSDIFKVYGIDSSLAAKILPFVEIDSIRLDSVTEDQKETPVIVNINTADSLTLLKVKGFGGFTAHKILTLRADLGGFHSIQQLIGVYPIDSARFEKVKDQIVCKGEFKKMDLNKAPFDTLRNHPYLSYDLVKNIVSFREDIRLFKSVSELRHIELVDALLFSKIAPYFYVEEKTGKEKSN